MLKFFKGENSKEAELVKAYLIGREVTNFKCEEKKGNINVRIKKASEAEINKISQSYHEEVNLADDNRLIAKTISENAAFEAFQERFSTIHKALIEKYGNNITFKMDTVGQKAVISIPKNVVANNQAILGEVKIPTNTGPQ